MNTLSSYKNEKMNAIPAENTRLRALEEAINLFSERGYSGVSMRDIAKAVGISPPALYNHFENKEALYREAVSAAFEDKEKRLLSSLQSKDAPLQRLRRFISDMVWEMDHDSRFRCLMQRELLDADTERLSFLGSFIFSQIQQPFMSLLIELKPGCDAFLVSEMIFGMVKQHFEMSPLHPFIADQDSLNKNVCDRTSTEVAQQVMDLLEPFFAGANHP